MNKTLLNNDISLIMHSETGTMHALHRSPRFYKYHSLVFCSLFPKMKKEKSGLVQGKWQNVRLFSKDSNFIKSRETCSKVSIL